MPLATPQREKNRICFSVSLFNIYIKWGFLIISGKNHLFRWLLTQMPDLKDRINQRDRDGCTLLHIVASSSEYSQKRSKYNYFFLFVWCFVFKWKNEQWKKTSDPGVYYFVLRMKMRKSFYLNVDFVMVTNIERF